VAGGVGVPPGLVDGFELGSGVGLFRGEGDDVPRGGGVAVGFEEPFGVGLVPGMFGAGGALPPPPQATKAKTATATLAA
ncbi:MAG: hypothetical protein M3R51_05175, partial [Candidatus Eremiobacteraeota bacterium]|nr:hypothetical protein [Candidatus Eremiobacteraeota bacterium]